MNNLTKKTLIESTVFQFGALIILMTVLLWIAGGIEGSEVITVLMTVFATYALKEGVAKGSEAFRDRGKGGSDA